LIIVLHNIEDFFEVFLFSVFCKMIGISACKWRRQAEIPTVFVPKHRVSIKSFPDYKHLLQENYVEYKHIFLPLLKLVSKILCRVYWYVLVA
jgi:hypothetical protein